MSENWTVSSSYGKSHSQNDKMPEKNMSGNWTVSSSYGQSYRQNDKMP